MAHRVGLTKYPAYADLNKRIKSFEKSKTSWGAPVDIIADAGFFDTGGRFLRCFKCDIGMRFFNEGEDPFFVHTFNSPQCQYMLEKMGKDYVRSVRIKSRRGIKEGWG